MGVGAGGGVGLPASPTLLTTMPTYTAGVAGVADQGCAGEGSGGWGVGWVRVWLARGRQGVQPCKSRGRMGKGEERGCCLCLGCEGKANVACNPSLGWDA